MNNEQRRAYVKQRVGEIFNRLRNDIDERKKEVAPPSIITSVEEHYKMVRSGKAKIRPLAEINKMGYHRGWWEIFEFPGDAERNRQLEQLDELVRFLNEAVADRKNLVMDRVVTVPLEKTLDLIKAAEKEADYIEKRISDMFTAYQKRLTGRRQARRS